jgi:hypothetical protein
LQMQQAIAAQKKKQQEDQLKAMQQNMPH